jgi:integrase
VLLENTSVESASHQADKNPTFKWVAECLYRHSKSGIYYALVKRNGKQFRKSLKTSDRQLAERSLTSFRVNVGRIANPTKDKGVTFAELAKDWFDAAKTRMKASSVRGKEVCIRQLNKHFGPLPVRKITTTNCNAWEKVRGLGIGASTFNHDLTALVAILNYGVREGLLLENPALTLKRRKLQKRKVAIPTTEQFSTLVKTIRSFDCRARTGADLVELLAYSGMRLSEATALIWADIDFERSQFTVTGGANGTKNHEARTVPLFPALRSLLEQIKNERQGKITSCQRVTPIVTAKKAIGSACKKAGLPYFHHHLFRHFFVSQAIEAGVDFKCIAAWVGHKDGGVLVARTYGHLRDTHSAEMAKRMTFLAL